MNERDDKETRIVIVVCVTAVMIAAIIVAGIVVNNRLAFAAGYERVAVQGMATAVWQKCDGRDVRDVNDVSDRKDQQ